MTVLIGWIGVDTHSPCSAYIMSDSRLSWGENPSVYNYGRKLFSLKHSPDILGYCGDVLFSSQVLSQISEMDEYGLLFQGDMSSTERSEVKDKDLDNYRFDKYLQIINNECCGQIIITGSLSDEILYKSNLQNATYFEALRTTSKLLKRQQ